MLLGTGRAYQILIPLGLLALFGIMMIWVAVTSRRPARYMAKPELHPLDRCIMAFLGLLLIAPFVVVLFILLSWIGR